MKENTNPLRYRVTSGDNFHPYDESETDLNGTFATYAEAVECAKRLVDKSLRAERTCSRLPFDPENLYDSYLDFGTPVSVDPRGEPEFDCFRYAEERCKEICREPAPERFGSKPA